MKYIFEKEDIKTGLCVEYENGNIAVVVAQQNKNDFCLVNLTHNYSTDHTVEHLLRLLNYNNYAPILLEHNIVG